MVSLALVKRRLDDIILSYGEFSSHAVKYVFSTPGKMLRPTLVLASAGLTACSDTLSTGAVDLAVAAELIHTASLVHDDIADASTLRRNKPSVNATYGNAAAVLTGDTLFATAFGLLERHVHTGALSVMCKAVNQMIEGELSEIHNRWNTGLTEAQYMKQVDLKTASLMRACCEVGARLAGAPDEVTQALCRFATSLGCAFQLIDDLIDFVGDQTKTGKPTLSDVTQGTFTLPVIYGFAMPAVRKRLDDLLTPSRAADSAKEVLKLLSESACLQRAADKAFCLLADARSALDGLPVTDSLDTLHALVDQVASSYDSCKAQQLAASEHGQLQPVVS